MKHKESETMKLKADKMDKPFEMDTEIEKRLLEMERRDYIFSKRFGKRDYVVVGCIVVMCIAILVLGAYL